MQSRIQTKVAITLLVSALGLGVFPAISATSNQDLQTFLQKYCKDGDPTADRTTRYSAASVSLDDKTQMELVYISGDTWCGSGGCFAVLLKPEGSSFKVIQEFTLARLPIRVLPSLTNGWHDLAMWVRGGGVSGRVAILRYNGSKYPSNPSMAPALKTNELPKGAELPLQQFGDLLYP